MNNRKNLDVKNTASAAKSILLAIASVGAFALALFLLPALRLFVFKHPGLIGVLVSVSGEVWLDWKEAIGKRASLKKFFMAFLVVSLAYELYEASESDEKAAGAINLAGKANERASLNEVKVAQLNQTNLQLSAALEVMRSNNFILQSNMTALFQFNRLTEPWDNRPIPNNEEVVSTIKKFPEQSVNLMLYPSVKNEPQSAHLFLWLKGVLIQAGWKVYEPPLEEDVNGTPECIQAGFRSGSGTDEQKTAGYALFNVLHDLGLPIEVDGRDGMRRAARVTSNPDTKIYIIVGHNPVKPK